MGEVMASGDLIINELSEPDQLAFVQALLSCDPSEVEKGLRWMKSMPWYTESAV